MRRPKFGPVSSIFATILFLRKTEAQVIIGDINSTIIIGQPVTVNWSRTGFSEPLQFQLLYTDSNSDTVTQTIKAGELGSANSNGITEGTLTFTPTALGNVQLEAIKSVTTGATTQTYTAFTSGSTIRLFVASSSEGISTTTFSTTSTSSPSDTHITTPSTIITEMSSTTQSSILSAPASSTHLLETRTSGSETPSPFASSSSTVNDGGPTNERLGIIVGSIMGGLAFIVLILLLICLRRKRRAHPEGFRRDMMVLEKIDSNGKTGTLGREKSLGEFEKGKDYEFDPISSITPLHNDFGREFDDRSTLAGSVYSRLSADTRTLAPSGISGVSTAYTEGELDIPKVPPLMPIAESLTPSLPHFQAPFRPKTERQMQIEQRIIALQSRFIVASGSGQDKVRTRAELKDKIERVKELRESAWAHGGKGEVPDVLID
ncbi:hypothetical protein PQX77_016724 [Marasmius sp. AFHP31]|nr:hypothetical protein PQX77_016724 [Marasmius sp. AFHP31]